MIPNGYLMFEDESFLDSTVAKMNALRKSGQFCDVRLQVCGHELMAHRAVLACCSPYLFEIFNSDTELHGVSHVKFEDLDPEAVEILLNYAYTAQLKADKELVREVYSAAKRLKMERVKQICGDYLLSKMDFQSAISFRNFASCMGDGRLLSKIDGYIQEHLLEISDQEDFLKLPRLKLEVMLEDNLSLPSNGKLYSKVINWVQRSLWESGEHLERLMEEQSSELKIRAKVLLWPSGVPAARVFLTDYDADNNPLLTLSRGPGLVQTLYYSADHKLHDGSLLEGQTEVFGNEDDHIQFVQVLNPHGLLGRASGGPALPGSLQLPFGFAEEACASGTQHGKLEWKYIASEKTNNNTYLCLAVLNGILCVIFLHGRTSPQSSPSSTPCMLKSMSFEAAPEELEEKLLLPMHYARSGLGTAELDGRLVAADELSCGETYDPQVDEWTQVPELRTNRCNAGVCSLNNKLYVVGGADPCGQKGLKNCDAFDPVTKTWMNCAPLNIRRHQAAVCELDNFMYVIGGAESWNCLNTVERYNPENNTWTLIAPMNVARRGAAVAVYEGQLFVVGGFDGSHALRCVEVYDPARNEWKMLGSMTSARSNAGVAVLGNLICAVGGFDGNNFLNTMETYNPNTNEWSPCVQAFSAL
ncbi:hypothetical protein JZ751_025011 [Albula glossodonta]|uniref:BTB domain-containing protein n=1 Tax=Albula glossodonta TaxID=121402 RepID=A0A8T2PIZ9_9TELE|nr:hypothetical protein JZ751_025011 [Albula glossodonta]